MSLYYKKLVSRVAVRYKVLLPLHSNGYIQSYYKRNKHIQRYVVSKPFSLVETQSAS
jgi:hypothetical protein